MTDQAQNEKELREKIRQIVLDVWERFDIPENISVLDALVDGMTELFFEEIDQ